MTGMRTPSVQTDGDTGVGKSSVINAIAGCTMADFASNVRGCALRSKEYRFDVDQICIGI